MPPIVVTLLTDCLVELVNARKHVTHVSDFTDIPAANCLIGVGEFTRDAKE
jgi:hypothetical protein